MDRIDESRVMEHFCMLTGLPEQEAQGFIPLTRACAARLAARLRPDADWQAQRDTLALAAAGMAAYQRALLEDAGGPEKFTLGELSVTNGTPRGESARLLQEELLAAAAPLLEPGGGFLMQVAL